MDFLAQIDGGSSKPFWIIRYENVIYKQKRCRAHYRVPKCSKIDLQSKLLDDFYTIPHWKIVPGPPEPLELFENFKIQLKSIHSFFFNKDCRLKKSTLCMIMKPPLDFTRVGWLNMLMINLSLTRLATDDLTIKIRFHLRAKKHIIITNTIFDLSCIRWLNHASTISHQYKGPYDYDTIILDLTCIRWLNHVNTISPLNKGRYDHETTLVDLTCIRWLNHANTMSL